MRRRRTACLWRSSLMALQNPWNHGMAMFGRALPPSSSRSTTREATCKASKLGAELGGNASMAEPPDGPHLVAGWSGPGGGGGAGAPHAAAAGETCMPRTRSSRRLLAGGASSSCRGAAAAAAGAGTAASLCTSGCFPRNRRVGLCVAATAASLGTSGCFTRNRRVGLCVVAQASSTRRATFATVSLAALDRSRVSSSSLLIAATALSTTLPLWAVSSRERARLRCRSTRERSVVIGVMHVRLPRARLPRKEKRMSTGGHSKTFAASSRLRPSSSMSLKADLSSLTRVP
mmetsp:Transcript_94532/g.282275  ORF Transcript_94532/g.282275 Transcript_94532/m.282275 type:complete len:289 (+) Transcript_94532:164-1030(+)